MSEKHLKIKEKIEVDKEVLLAMPRNNEKNKEKYNEKIDSLKQEYSIYKNKIENEIKRRYEEASQIVPNVEIEALENKKESLGEYLYLFNKTNSSYEKMKLDRIVFKLSRFYKDNLKNLNNVILFAIKKFKKAGIELTKNDFNYTIYVNEYMDTFFAELSKGDVNSELVTNKFNDIYWKCPEIVTHIELNIRYLYLQNQKVFDKYLEKTEQEILNRLNMTSQEIFQEYDNYSMKIEELRSKDKALIISKFISGEWRTSNYTDDKIMANIEKLVKEERTQVSNPIENEELRNDIEDFLNVLYEYKNYLKYKFIIDDIKARIEGKEKYKGVYQNTLKEIIAKEKELNKINKKATSKGIFGTIKKEKNIKYNDLIPEIKALYKKLDENRICEYIYNGIENNITLNDTLKFATSFYTNLIRCLFRDSDITYEDADMEFQSIEKFANNPYCKLLNNLTILDEKNIAVIISDRYRLLSFKVSKENFEENSLDAMIELAQTIKNGYDIKNSELTINEIEEICKINDFIKKIG